MSGSVRREDIIKALAPEHYVSFVNLCDERDRLRDEVNRLVGENERLRARMGRMAADLAIGPDDICGKVGLNAKTA